ncbi:hypothetical protein U0070_019220, partial [Myodes glareolus]
ADSCEIRVVWGHYRLTWGCQPNLTALGKPGSPSSSLSESGTSRWLQEAVFMRVFYIMYNSFFMQCLMRCNAWPCSGMVDYFISRPTEDDLHSVHDSCAWN